VQVGSNVNTLMQQVMAMRSPALLARMPEVEAMAWQDRVALVNRGHHNITQLIRSWDKFGDLLLAQGWTRQEVKQKAKALKNARQKLEMGMRLADPKKIPKPFEAQAHSAFDVLAAWFLMEAGSLESILLGVRITKDSFGSMVAPLPPSLASDGAGERQALPVGLDEHAPADVVASTREAAVEEEIVEVGMVEADMPGFNSVDGAPEELVDRVKDDYRD
jgi:hypothetical protein